MTRLTPDEAYYILKNLDTFIANFETSTEQKMTPGAIQILHQILLEAAFPPGGCAESVH